MTPYERNGGLDWDRWRDAITAALDPQEVISDYVHNLQPRNGGRRLVGECPFPHDSGRDTKRRFYMNTDPERNYPWKCYRCGEKGNVYSLVQRMKGITYGDATRQIAERYGIPAPASLDIRPLDGSTERNIQEYLTLLADFGHVRLVGNETSPAHQDAMNYLINRGFPEASIRAFRLGVVKLPERPNVGKEQLQIDCGLYHRRADNGIYRSFFDERIAIPVYRGDSVVNVVFRTMREEEKRYKYINIRNTNYFFNQHRATGREVYVVEGQLDAIALETMGFPAVATLGCSNTTNWVGRRFGQNTRVHLLFDNDEAGHTATQTLAMSLFRAGRWDMDVMFYRDDGVDSAKFLQANGPNANGHFHDATVRYDVMPWLMGRSGIPDRYTGTAALRTAMEMADQMVGLPAMVRETYLEHIAEAAGLSMAAMHAHIAEQEDYLDFGDEDDEDLFGGMNTEAGDETATR